MVFRPWMLLLIVFLGACSTVREYPRCYLFRSPDASDVASTNKNTEVLLEGAFAVSTFGMSKDVVLIDAYPETHKELSVVWSSVGCVNLRREPPATGEMIDKWIVARCQEYLDQLVRPERINNNVSRTDVAKKFARDFTCH